MARTPVSTSVSATGAASRGGDELGIPQQPRILFRATPEQSGAVWLRRLVEHSPIRLPLSPTVVDAASQHAKDDVRRHPVLFHSSSVYRIAAPPKAVRRSVSRPEAANPVNMMHEWHQPTLVLDQELVMMRSEQRAMFMAG